MNAGKLWKIGDRVLFAHQKKGETAFTITSYKATFQGPMVELRELPGEFAAHLFIAAEEVES
jgi:hypothetical protein